MTMNNTYSIAIVTANEQWLLAMKSGNKLIATALFVLLWLFSFLGCHGTDQWVYSCRLHILFMLLTLYFDNTELCSIMVFHKYTNFHKWAITCSVVYVERPVRRAMEQLGKRWPYARHTRWLPPVGHHCADEQNNDGLTLAVNGGPT